MASNVSFTVILLSYNHEKYVEEAICSILSQAYLPEHLIVVDDCSQDNSVQLIRDVLNRAVAASIKVDLILKEQNGGVCSAINACSHLIATDLVITAAADDVSYEGRLSVLAREWTSLGEPDAIYSNASLINESSEQIGSFQLAYPVHSRHKALSCRNSLGLPAFYGAGSCYSSRLFRRFGPLPTDIRNEDFMLMFRAWIMGGVAYSNGVLIGYRQHTSNLSINRQLALSNRLTTRCRLRYRGYFNYLLNLGYAMQSTTVLPWPTQCRVYLVLISEACKALLRVSLVPLEEIFLHSRNRMPT